MLCTKRPGTREKEFKISLYRHLTEMASVCKSLAGLLFFLIASPLLPSNLFSHAASTSPTVTHHRIIIMTAADSEDYDDDYANAHSSPPKVLTTKNNVDPEFCDYNSCLENQRPCSELSEQTGCLCPGLSGADEPPHAPRIQELLSISKGNNKGKVEVQWCAPSSVVTSYRVVVDGRNNDALEFGGAQRQGLVGSLEVGTKVCVEAVNSVGRSNPSDFSCQRYDPSSSSDHNILAWIIGGGVALLLGITMAAILWKHKMCQKGKRDSTDGLGNPSYSTGGTL